ncbi:hypothetical protein BDV32DRAFT_129860 [Aspergillus pseudonomiae]|nr:hypothetical protein BDV32DRAFT_129860 [Aspergillus pseudonomiae]
MGKYDAHLVISIIRSVSEAKALNKEYAGSDSTKHLPLVLTRRNRPRLGRSRLSKIKWTISSGSRSNRGVYFGLILDFLGGGALYNITAGLESSGLR